jgi:hypothetical protein
MAKPSVQRVLMSRELARRWLTSRSRAEHRLRIFGSQVRNFPGLLRSIRDDRVRIAGVQPISDLGIQEGFDCVTVWSSDYKALRSLQKWAEEKGMETSGVW